MHPRDFKIAIRVCASSDSSLEADTGTPFDAVGKLIPDRRSVIN